MMSLQLHCHFLPLRSKLVHTQKVKTNQKLLWLSIKTALHSQNISSSQKPGRTKAISDSLVLGVTSPEDIPVFIQIILLLINLYGMTYFVIPYFIPKGLGDEVNEDEKLYDDSKNPSKDETGKATSIKQTSQREKQDFNRTNV